MPEIVEEYKQHIYSKYKDSSKETLNRLLQPTARMFNSANTQEEL
jgi:hypothetical protein